MEVTWQALPVEVLRAEPGTHHRALSLQERGIWSEALLCLPQECWDSLRQSWWANLSSTNQTFLQSQSARLTLKGHAYLWGRPHPQGLLSLLGYKPNFLMGPELSTHVTTSSARLHRIPHKLVFP